MGAVCPSILHGFVLQAPWSVPVRLPAPVRVGRASPKLFHALPRACGGNARHNSGAQQVFSAHVEVILKQTTKIIPCQTKWQGIRPTLQQKVPIMEKIITTTLGVALIISNALPAPIELTLILYAAFAMAVGYGLRNIPRLYKELKAV